MSSSSEYESSGYEDIGASLILVFGIILVTLYLSNRKIYPLAQREPVLAGISNLGHTFLVSMWLLETRHPVIPYISRKVFSQIFLGLVVIPFFVRAWKLFMDAGITRERAEGRIGWFIHSREFRNRAFLEKIAVVLGFLQLIICLLSIFTEPQYNLSPARVGTTTDNDSLVTNLPLVYWIAYCLFSIAIARTEDGFFIKWELALVGIGSFTFSLLYRTQITSKVVAFPCSVPNCGLVFACMGWLWMLGCSVMFPLYIARKDRRFSFTRCFRFPSLFRKRGARGSHHSSTATESSTAGDGEDFPSYHDGDVFEPRELTPEQIAKLTDVPLITFLSYPAGREAFRAFTVREFSIENLLFVEAVSAYRNKPRLTKDDFEVVYRQYIIKSAINQVNLPFSITQMLKARHEDPSELNLNTCFDEAAKHVVQLLQRDAFKRFQRTAEWRTHIVAFGQGEPKTTMLPISPSSSDDHGSSVIEMSEPASPTTPIFDFVSVESPPLDCQVVSVQSSTEPLMPSPTPLPPQNTTYQELE